MTDVITFRDGDIFRWRYKDEAGRASRPMGSYIYHCKSRIAAVVDGRLRDTFWGDSSDGSWLNPDEVELGFEGNTNDMTEINRWDAPLYRRDDLVDLAHSNNSGAKLYVKPGAQRDPDSMRAHIEYAKARLQEKIASAQRSILECDKDLARIADGDTSGYFRTYQF